MKRLFWVTSNIFGWLFGWPFLEPLYHGIINLCLHGLGYDTMYLDSWTGEEWFIRKVLAPTKPKTCLDIGANVGLYSRLLLKHTGAQIYAIEPSSSAFSRLQELKGSIKSIQVAIANFDGEATLNFKRDADPRASLDKNVRTGNEEKVPVLRVESLVQKHNLPTTIDFIKIDTEGFEEEVLRGLGTIRPRFIQFEFNMHHMFRNRTLYGMTLLLPEYDFYRLLPHGWLKINPSKYLNNIYMFCNIIAVKK